MKLRFWGVRGSFAMSGRDYLRYGGNTTSVELRTSTGGLIVLDAGTGIRALGLSLAREHPPQIHLLLTHMHLDHVEGLGFFAPLFDPACTITIWGPRPDDLPLRDHLAAYLSPPLFPVPFERFPSTIEFVEVREDAWEMDGVRIRSAPVRHPGPTVGYRIEENGNSLAFIPDNEPALEADSGLALAAGVDLLLHDAQYTAEEYATRAGWGHTAIPDFASYVREAAPSRTVMFHHDPSHTDEELEAMEQTARELVGLETVHLAREGVEIAIE